MLWWILGVYAALTVIAFFVGRESPDHMTAPFMRSADDEIVDEDERMPFALSVRWMLMQFHFWCFYPWGEIAFYLPGGKKKRALDAKEYVTEQLVYGNAQLQEGLQLCELKPEYREGLDEVISSLFKVRGREREWDYREVAEKNLYEEFSVELFPLTQFQYWRSLVWQTFAFLGWPGPACVGLWMGIQAARERRKYAKEED